MKKIIFIFGIFFLFSLSFVSAVENDESKTADFGIDLIKNRTGENKAGQYFKNFDKDNTILFLDGFWDMEFLGLSSFEFFKDYGKVNSFQGVFKQKANLSLLLLLNNTFYFETLYKDDYKKSSLALGYFGNDDSYIRHIRAGNTNIKFPLNYGYINTGGGKFISPGVMGSFSGNKWNADAVLRYESSEYNSKIYYGNSEIIENKISINTWQRARHFYIPSENLYGRKISVFVKDSADSQWRPLSPDEFSVDARLKVLSLKKSYPEGVAVNYFDPKSVFTGENNPVNSHLQNIKTYFSDPGINEIKKIVDSIYTDVNFYKENIFGKDCLVLKKKNTFSPFEIASRYNTPSNENTSSISIIDLHSQKEVSYFKSGLESSNIFSDDFEKLKFIQVLNLYQDYDFGKIEQMFPFSKTNYKIYLPNNKDEADISLQILCKNYIPSSAFTLPDTAIPGSIRVFKNKIRILNFSYNELTHILTVNEPVLSNDIIEIQWKEGLMYSDSGLVRFAGGGHWQPINGMDVFFASSGDWEVTKQKTNPIDTYKLSSGIEYKNENIKTGSVFGFESGADRNKRIKDHLHSFQNRSYFNYIYRGNLYSKNGIPIFSNPNFYFEENFRGVKGNSELHTKTNTSIDIWKIKMAGSLSLKNNFSSPISSKIIESYGHSVLIPIYFFTSSEDFFVNRYDRILRRECKINLKKYIDANYLTAVDYNKEYVIQKTNASISPDIQEYDFGIIYTQLNFSVNQKYKSIFDPSSASYTSAWTKSLFDMYSPGEKNAEDRSGELKFLFNYFSNEENKKGIKLSGFNFDAFSKTAFQNKTKKISSDETGFEISIPFDTGKIFFSPIIKRKITKEKNEIEAAKQASYTSDLNSLFTGIGEQYWLFSKPFFYDMFDKKIINQIQTDNRHLSFSFFNSYGFNLSRLISGSIKDLYIPLEFGTAVSRLVQSRQIKESMDIYGLDFSIKYTSLNFSGKYGYFDWFKFYDQDELNRIYKFGFSFGQDFFKFKFNSVHTVYFFFSLNNKFGIENEAAYTSSKTGNQKLLTDDWKEKFSFIFLYNGGSSLPRLIIETFSKVPLYDSREERFSIEFSQTKGLEKLNYKISFKHTQSTKIGSHGEIRIFTELEGRSTSSNSFLLNLNAGISGKVDF